VPAGLSADEIASVRAELDQSVNVVDDALSVTVEKAAPIWWVALDDGSFDDGIIRKTWRKGDRFEENDPIPIAAPGSFGRFLDDH
jgi:hypothetical protein